MTNPALIAPTFGDADYFDSLLNLERNAIEHLDLPLPLHDIILSILIGFENEGAPIAPHRASRLHKNLIAAVGSDPDSIVLERRLPEVHQIIVLDPSAVIFLAGLLLGQQNSARIGAPSPTERQIVEGFLTQAELAFPMVATQQKLIDWSSFMAACLPLTAKKSGPAIVVMANRRADSADVEQDAAPDLAQQTQIRHAISNGVCKVDYVLDAGQVSLATLRSLKPGSILPLNPAERANVQAKANGMPVLNGTWQFAPDKMRVTITDIIVREAPIK